MINADKTKLMTRAVNNEKNYYSRTLSLQRKFRRGRSVSTFFLFALFGFSSFVLICLIVFIALQDTGTLSSFLQENPVTALLVITGAGTVFSFLYALIAYKCMLNEYKNVRTGMREYYLDLQSIDEIERKEQEEAEV